MGPNLADANGTSLEANVDNIVNQSAQSLQSEAPKADLCDHVVYFHGSQASPNGVPLTL